MLPAGKNSLLCPNCRKLISADEPVCPYCGLSKPGASWKMLFSRLASLSSVDTVKIIIYVNVIFYLFSLLLNPSSLGLSGNPLTFLSPSNASLLILGATGRFPIDGYGRWWTLLSASFLHGGILHIFFNMVALWQLGPFLLREFGANRFLIMYIISGIFGFFVSYLAGVAFTIGASASICGLIGAILYYGKARGGFYGELIYRQAMGWVLGLVVFGLLAPGINNWAHIGGIAGGILLSFIVGYKEKKAESMSHRILSMFCILITAMALLWAAVQAIYYFIF
jgi:rhomboid protease GluP